MQLDMHFHATAVLARAAGFKQAEALLLGTAAQYVDDAQDGRDILVGGQPFAPLYTANDLGRYLKSQEPQVWRKVYLPFHFLPPQPVSSPNGVFLTQAGSPMVQRLLADVAQDPEPDATYRLVRLGLALHTVADSWSHQGFSGRWHDENQVSKLELLGASHGLEDALRKDLEALSSGLEGGIPLPVAHFQAGFVPDYPFQEWRATFAPLHGAPARVLHLVNQDQYRTALRFIYGQLCAWPKQQADPVLPWESILPDINQCLANVTLNRQARCPLWQDTFGHLFPDTGGMPAYDMHAWEIEALGAPFKQTPFSDAAEDPANPPRYPGRPGFAASAWAQFHGAAAKQRAWLAKLVQV